DSASDVAIATVPEQRVGAEYTGLVLDALDGHQTMLPAAEPGTAPLVLAGAQLRNAFAGCGLQVGDLGLPGNIGIYQFRIRVLPTSPMFKARTTAWQWQWSTPTTRPPTPRINRRTRRRWRRSVTRSHSTTTMGRGCFRVTAEACGAENV